MGRGLILSIVLHLVVLAVLLGGFVSWRSLPEAQTGGVSVAIIDPEDSALPPVPAAAETAPLPERQATRTDAPSAEPVPALQPEPMPAPEVTRPMPTAVETAPPPADVAEPEPAPEPTIEPEIAAPPPALTPRPAPPPPEDVAATSPPSRIAPARRKPTPPPVPDPEPEVAAVDPAPEPAPTPEPEPQPESPADPFDALLKSVEQLDRRIEDQVARDGEGSAIPQEGTPLPGTASRGMSASEMDTIVRHVSQFWNVPVGVAGIESMVVPLEFRVGPDGGVSDIRVVENGRFNSDVTYRVVAESARRALQAASPLPWPEGLPTDDRVRFNFRPPLG